MTKKTPCFGVLCLAYSLTFLLIACYAESTGVKNIEKCTIPDAARKYCSTAFPGWIPLSLSDLDGEMVEYLKGQKDSEQCPNLLKSDFDGDRETDLALFLSKQEEKGILVKLVVVLCKKERPQKSSVLCEFESEQVRPEIYIAAISKGRKIKPTEATGDAKQPMGITLPEEAIVLHYFERSAKAFYWNGSSFCEVWIED